MQEQAQFDLWVDGQVKERLRVATDWQSLLCALPGVYPSVVLESVRRVGLEHLLVTCPRRQRTAAASFAMGLWVDGILPTPHPLDGTWWYADNSLETLLHLIESCTNSYDRVLMLGTPSLFRFSVGRKLRRELTCVDRGDVGLFNAGHESLVEDLLLRQPRLSRPAAAIVADPPWYSRETRAFLLMARRNALHGGRVLLSVPPIGTRPGIQREWEEMVLWAAQIGLELIDYRYGVLPYVSPLFERNALKAAGIPECPADWRRGDLAIFRSVDREALESEASFAPDVAWRECSMGGVRVRVQGHSRGWKNPELREIVPGNVLPSVSRRDRRLSEIDVWTSGNRVYRCENPALLLLIGSALAAGECPLEYVRSRVGPGLDTESASQIHQAAEQLREITEIEDQEAEDWKQTTHDHLVPNTT